MDYTEFLRSKSQLDGDGGFEPTFLPDSLFDFQKALVVWAQRKGRGAIFADCGLGKTLVQLTWAENVVRHTNRPVLILTPLAVSAQTCREGERFGIECHRSGDGKLRPGINVTNYERLHLFNTGDFSGVVCDESSILKSFDGSRRAEITEFMRTVPYRNLCTATAAPNDFTELGTSSEALGYLGHMDMLNRFFKNDMNNSATGRAYGKVAAWRFKGHAERPFWRWVCSWARAARSPRDLGFDDGAFKLPELEEVEHVVKAERLAEGALFPLAAIGLREQREERHRTLQERCEKVASLVSGTGKSALVWCQMNDEGDLLESLIPGAVQVSGGDSDDEKEEKFLAFVSGDSQAQKLVTKPKIGGWGLNFQHCAHVTFFPSHSFEQYYQGVRRCWRFGQKEKVRVDIVTTEGECVVMENLQRKRAAADRMFANLMEYMHRYAGIRSGIDFKEVEAMPAWL